MRLEDRTVAGFEALLRWEHPRRGSIPPSDFIPVAESCGLIVQLGLFAMQRAAEDLVAWQKQIGDVPLSVSVNLSSRQLIRRDLVSDVRSVIARSNIKPRCFRLELTESLVMDNPEQSAHVLAKLKQIGIGLSLDDFGTGYSSLSYLTRFPFDTIKIDKSFVDNSTPKRAVLIKSMVNMAHELGLSVVAEGISDENDALQLQADGLRICAELHVRRADHGRRRAEDAEGAVSRRSGVTGRMAEMRQVDADRRQDAVVFAVDVGVEHQVDIGRAGQPAIGGDLAFELPGAPAGIAERHQRLARPAPEPRWRAICRPSPSGRSPPTPASRIRR